jgi:hypothetical protein
LNERLNILTQELKNHTFILLFFSVSILFSQNSTITGILKDESNNPLSLVNVLLFQKDTAEPFKGVTTDEKGKFQIKNVKDDTYKITFSFIGFSTIEQNIELVSAKNIGVLILKEDLEFLNTVVVNAKRPTILKTSEKLVFNVENSSLSVGNTFDLLKKTPGVVIIGEKIEVRFTAPAIYLNGRRVYLSSSEVVSLLRSIDASFIKSVEVITNPSAQFDAEAGVALNIITSKAISIGYKGSVNGTYEQGVFSKYNIGTSHFYKNKWINLYGSYSFSPRKDYKEDQNSIQYFESNGAVNSIWKTHFEKVARSNAHQANLILDLNIATNQTLGFSANISASPNKTFNNYGLAEIYSAQQQLDSTFTTASALEYDTSNLSFGLEYKIELDKEGSAFTGAANYIDYNNEQFQSVDTHFFSPEGSLLRNNRFNTNANQSSEIFTGQADVNTSVLSGDLKAGIKYSDIDTNSKLDFFDIDNNDILLNSTLSDDFNYKENIYAEYVSYQIDFQKWNLTGGLRGEYTFINAISRSLGKLETQKYFELFPTAGIHYELSENSGLGLSYKRAIQRPRYQSLNPFKYFITENNYNAGNPNLVPAIENKITLSYDYKNKLFFELYYQHFKNSLSILTFQDNQNRVLRNIDTNLISDFQYSFDIVFVDSIKPWWFLQLVTSTFYLENEFYSVESLEETYSNDTYGFYASMYSNFNLNTDRTLTADLNVLYISNFITGGYDYKNQFNASISVRKSFWNKRASITVGVDDIFDTNTFPVTTNYYNQDNSYFARAETRLFRLGFRYNFGNARLNDNNRNSSSAESNRLD